MPMVVAQAVPSEVQSTVGSDWRESPGISGREVCPQLAPPSCEKYWAWAPLATSFDAATILLPSLKLIRMSDSLRGFLFSPETRTFTPKATAAAALTSTTADGFRS